MRILILLSLLFPLAARPFARAVTARVEPRLATCLMAGAALLLAATSCGSLGLLVLSELVRVPTLAHLGHMSARVIAGGALPGGWTSLVAGVFLGAALLAVTAFAVRRVRALADARRYARELPGRAELVITGDEAADAFAVPGRPGRIVVSSGMLDALDARGRTALLAHERTHLTARHHWFTGAARLAAAANPLVTPLAKAVEYSVERWADEAAADEVGDRRLVAHAIAKAALASKATRPQRGVLATLGAVFSGTSLGRRRARSRQGCDRTGAAGGLANAGPIPRRVAALLAPAPQTGLPALAAGLLFLGSVAVCALLAADHLQDLMSFAHAVADPH